MHYTYTPKGTCSTRIDLDVEDGVITHCAFTQGCDGNTQGIARLVTGRRAEEVIPLLSDISCNGHSSCPAQLAVALKHCLSKH